MAASIDILSGDIFQECVTLQQEQDAPSSQADFLLQCITEALRQGQIRSRRDVNSWFFVYAGALVFFMQAGFAMLCAGSVRLKNVQNTKLKNLLDACGAALGFFSVGEYSM